MAYIEILDVRNTLLWGGDANDKKDALEQAVHGKVSLKGANLVRWPLDGANLAFANLEGADLTGASVSNANLGGANLAGATLRGAVFSGSDMSKADISGADLSEAYFASCRLTGATFTGAKANRVSFSNAEMGKAKLNRVQFHGMVADGANLTGADLASSQLDKSNLQYAILSKANLKGASLQKSRLEQAVLDGAVLMQVNLTGANLSRARLRGVDLHDADLIGTDMRRADMTDAYLRKAVFKGTQLQGAKMRGVDLSRTSLTGVVNMRDVDLSGAFVDGADFTGVDMTGVIKPDQKSPATWEDVFQKRASEVDWKKIEREASRILNGIQNGLEDYKKLMLRIAAIRELPREVADHARMAATTAKEDYERWRAIADDVNIMRWKYEDIAGGRNASKQVRTSQSVPVHILQFLAEEGWDVRDRLQIPHATSRNKQFRLWFKGSEVYLSQGRFHEFQDARLLPINTSKVSPEQFFRLVGRSLKK